MLVVRTDLMYHVRFYYNRFIGLNGIFRGNNGDLSFKWHAQLKSILYVLFIVVKPCYEPPDVCVCMDLTLPFSYGGCRWRYEKLPIAGDFPSSYTKAKAG